MNLYDYLYKLYIRNKLELKSIYIYIKVKTSCGKT